jgi:transcriptional regulator with XRE-family HTH domain
VSDNIAVGNYWEPSQPASGKISVVEAVADMGSIPEMSDPRLDPAVSRLVRAIFTRMNRLGLTPTSLALRAGRNPTYFRDLFQGRSSAPSGKYLPAIAQALECEVADLLNDPGAASGQPGARGEVYQPDEIALLGFWRVLSDAGKQRVMRAIIREANRVMRGEPEDTSDI